LVNGVNSSNKNSHASDDDLSSSSAALSSSASAHSMSKLLSELNELKEKEKLYLQRIDLLEEENEKFKTVAIDFEDLFQNLVKDKEESEIKLKNEIIELTKERDHLQEDVIGVERAFDDLHRRFEKLKTKVEEFKKVNNFKFN
jgi:chromosome segregation ATPase